MPWKQAFLDVQIDHKLAALTTMNSKQALPALCLIAFEAMLDWGSSITFNNFAQSATITKPHMWTLEKALSGVGVQLGNLTRTNSIGWFSSLLSLLYE